MKKNIKVIIPIVIIAVVCLVVLFLYFMPFMSTITMDTAVQKGIVMVFNNYNALQGDIVYIKLLPVFPKFLIVSVTKDNVNYLVKIPIKDEVSVVLMHKTNFVDEVKEEMKNNPKETETDACMNVAKKHNIDDKNIFIYGSVAENSILFGHSASISDLKEGYFVILNQQVETGFLSVIATIP